jgi:hypothetical protein
MSEIEKRGWEDELNAAWAEVNKARRQRDEAVDSVAARHRHVRRATAPGAVRHDACASVPIRRHRARKPPRGERTP